MTQQFLLEIGLEEIPAHTVKPSSEQLVERVGQFLTEQRLTYNALHGFATPRRLAVLVEDLAEQQPDLSEEMKGPAKTIAQDAEGNWSKAAAGFARGQGATTDDIIFKELKGVEYAYVVKATKGKKAAEILPEIKKVIEAMTFNTNMRWADKPYKYIRPVHWIVALLDQNIIPFEVFDITAGRKTRGHRFLGNDIEIMEASSYQAQLADEFVIADMEDRQALIVDQINELATNRGWKINIEDDLLEEVTNLVEYPTVFAGKFDEKYLDIPDAVLITSMKDHQRYFYVADSNDKLLPYFIGVRNGDHVHIDNVIAGNEKVLTARLEDAAFFYAEDQKHTIAEYVERLKKVTFHDKIGSMYEKMQRVQIIGQIMANRLELNGADRADLQRATEIYKFDLVTGMVGEFAELQGEIGGIYALKQGEHPTVAKAISEQYMPISAEGELPQSEIGAILAVADKFDSLASFFAIGLIPNGSNDPYALRRQAYGIVRIIKSRDWHFPIMELQQDFISGLIDNKATFDLDYKTNQDAIADFFKDRVRQLFSGMTTRRDVVDTVVENRSQDLLTMFNSADVISAHADEDDFKDTIEALTRVMRLGLKAQISGDQLVVDPTLFDNPSELALYESVEKIRQSFKTNTLEQDYEQLHDLRPLIEEYFDKTMIMVDDQKVKDNRLTQLLIITQLVRLLGDFNQLLVK